MKEYITSLEAIVTTAFLIISVIFFSYWGSDLCTSLHLGGWMVFFVWCSFQLFLGRYEIMGNFIFTIVDVAHTMVMFIITAIPTFLAFTFGFYILLYANPNFSQVIRTFLYAMVMTVNGYYDHGDFGYDNIQAFGGRNYSTQIMYLLFLVLMNIIFMTLLTAITVNSTRNLRNRYEFKLV